jgi:16S rRNA (uracil1498-N3)-methyltransferase
MRLHRFYVAQPLGEEVVIADVSIIKQWAKVFRYTKGDFVILFNGDGLDITFLIESISSKECVLSKTNQSPAYIPKKKVTLYLSLIKKDNFELAVQKATELGVSTIVPIISERSEKKDLNEDRLHKIATEAAEQCGRGDAPTILPIIELSDLMELTPPHDVTFVLQMGGEPILTSELAKKHLNIGFFVGPEGGWTEKEEELFEKHNMATVSLGSTVLRAETAAIVGSAFLLQ